MTGRTRSQEQLAAMMADPVFSAVTGKIQHPIGTAQREMNPQYGLNAATVLDGMAYLAAAITEANPSFATNQNRRRGVEDSSTLTHQIARAFRKMYEDAGEHMAGKLGIVGARGVAND